MIKLDFFASWKPILFLVRALPRIPLDLRTLRTQTESRSDFAASVSLTLPSDIFTYSGELRTSVPSAKTYRSLSTILRKSAEWAYLVRISCGVNLIPDLKTPGRCLIRVPFALTFTIPARPFDPRIRTLREFVFSGTMPLTTSTSGISTPGLLTLCLPGTGFFLGFEGSE